MAYIGDVNTQSKSISSCFNADGIIEIQGSLAIDGHQGHIGQIAALWCSGKHRVCADNLRRTRQHHFRKSSRYLAAQQFNIFIFIKHTQLHQDPKNLLDALNTGFGRHGLGNCIIIAIFAKKIIRS